MKKIKGLIITNAFSMSDGTKLSVKRFEEEFKKLDVELFHENNMKIMSFVDDFGGLVNNVGDYDFIIYNDKDRYVGHMLEKLGYRLFNSIDAIKNCDDKMRTHIILANNGIRMPKTMSYPLCYTYNNNYSDFINNVLYNFSFPFIIKENYGSLGKQVYLIANKEDLIRKETELRYKPHLYQEFIRESSGSDYRLFVVGNEVVASMNRNNTSNFKANVALGGSGKPFTPSEELKNTALKVSELLGLDYCAIDFVKNRNNEFLLIEVNSNPFFTELEKVSKINIANKIANLIISKIQEK